MNNFNDSPIIFDPVPEVTRITVTEGDLIRMMSEGFAEHLFYLWVAMLVYALIHRYKFYLKEKRILSQKNIEYWDYHSHDIAILICLYYPLSYILT